MLSLRDDSGMVLLVTLIVIFLMLLSGLWLVYHTGVLFRITGSINRYEVGLNLADGASEIGVGYLVKYIPMPEEGISSETEVECPLPSDMNQWQRDNGTGYSYRTRIFWENYSTEPPPGWMVNWQGYSRFYSMQYKVVGEGRVGDFPPQRVSILAVKVVR